MSPKLRFQLAKLLLTSLCFFGMVRQASSQSNKVMGELQFEGASKVERDSGVWIDGGYVGFLKELKGDKKVLLLPGEHRLEVRQSGYDNFVRKIVVEPGQVQIVHVVMHLSPGARVPDVTAMLKVTVQPGRAAVFLDDQYIGHASELGGAVHSLSISPGKHRIKVELPGYRTFETEVNLLRGQKSEVKTELVKGSIEQAGPDVKPPQ
ncbi:MAG TPA: PEGA domain-containing protein [Candidatus Limnocylindrales bacterium]|nr:PEGA domain-containing protein [Candidatus Limnocylindrales bacterium]